MQISRATITLVAKIAASWRRGDLRQSRRMGVTVKVSRYNLLTSEARKHAPGNLCRESKRQAGIIPIIIIAVVDSRGGPRDPPPSLGLLPVVIYRACRLPSASALSGTFFSSNLRSIFFLIENVELIFFEWQNHWKRVSFRERSFGRMDIVSYTRGKV